MDTLGDRIPGRYEVYGIGRGETNPTLRNMVGFSDSFDDAVVLMTEERDNNPGVNYCIYDVITKMFFDPEYVYSQAIAAEAMKILKGSLLP